MEKITQEIFKSGDKLYLTEKECLLYEKRVKDNKFAQAIITFLSEEGFVQSLSDRAKRLSKKDLHFTTYEFLFISDVMYLNKYVSENELMAYDVSIAKEKIKLQLCEIETFKMFYSEMIKINQ